MTNSSSSTVLSLKLKLTLGAIAIGLVLLLAQSFGQFHALRGDLSERIESEQFNLLSELASHLDDKVNERKTALARTAEAMPLENLGNVQSLENHLRHQAALLTLFDDLYIFDAQGLLLADWPLKPGRRGLDMSSRDYIQGVLQTRQPFISQAMLGKATQQPIIVIAAPVLDTQGKVVAIVGGVLNLYQPKLIGTLNSRKIGDSGYFYIVSNEHRFIAHPDRSRIMQASPAASENPALGRAYDGFEGTIEGTNSRGLAGLFTFKRLPSTNWILASVVPAAEAFAPITGIQRRMALITGLLMLLIIPLLWGLSHRLLSPLGQLAQAMRKRAVNLQLHQPVHPVPKKGSAEILTVAAAFNEFLAARNAAAEALAISEAERSRMIENLAQAKDAAEAANLAKTQFLANMSHELRTPMNGVIGMIDLAQMNALDDETREFLEVARSSAESLLVILNDILDISKIEAGKLQIEKTTFDLALLLKETLRLMTPQMDQGALAHELRLPLDLPHRLIGDPLRIRQIVLNLLGNAIKFTHQGKITVNVEIVSKNDNCLNITIAVTDTGTGIPPDRLEAIFHAFTQADNSITRRFGGTGLGLTISSQLVELMGGQLSVDSEQGVGSTFRFSLALGLSE